MDDACWLSCGVGPVAVLSGGCSGRDWSFPRLPHMPSLQYLENIYRWFGLPNKMISNRDPRFTSHFGIALAKKLGIRQNLSSAFHPQTDRLSERKNQWIEQYLRLITAMQLEDWEQWLPLASAVHNNWKNATTGLLPNQILLGYETELIPTSDSLTNNERVEDRIKTMTKRCTQVIEALNKATWSEHVPLVQYNTSNQVWLEATNLCFPLQATKLNPKLLCVGTHYFKESSGQRQGL